jgi:hypothetical protein
MGAGVPPGLFQLVVDEPRATALDDLACPDLVTLLSR